MGDLLKLIWYAVAGLFRSRAALQTEVLALRHQLNVLRRRAPKRVAVSNIDRLVKIGNGVLRSALYMPAMSATRYNPAIVALVTRLKAQGRLKPKQIVVAAMRKLLVLCFGVLKTGKPFDPAIAMGC
jgi:hypothetical protein